MKTFLHCIITTLNVRTKPKYSWPKNNEWLKKRIHLFETFTIKSIKNQINQNFKYIVYVSDYKVDRSIIDEFIERNGDYCDIQVISGDGWFNHEKHILKHLRENYDLNNYKYLYTTTLDSDDSLNRNYVEMVQDRNPHQYKDVYILNFKHGYRYFMGEEKVYFYRWDWNSMFTMIEPVREKMYTCKWDYSHVTICRDTFKRDDQRKNIGSKEPMWFQIIHDCNVQTMYREGNRWANLINKSAHIDLDGKLIKRLFDINIEDVYSLK